MKQILKITCAALLVLTTVAACHKDKPKAFAIDDPFVRATPQRVSAGYFGITNQTKQDDALTGVTADWAGRAELHNTVKDKDDVMQMVPVETIALPAGQKVQLAPGGMHVMLFDLKKELTVSEEHKLTLHFQHAAPQMVTFTVRPITYKGLEHKH
jgi:copper(I)-binding protein